ncbi:hypothetical protein [Nocardioides sp. GY 10127]|uniref:hypothetical protein n=1 Tax=Nocardioides sp. GY 10127 TaxID=2569762 RepID=UPI0010A8FADD|nr:hypothetical protein [Nocardioides sp. GY 10127]TIC79419.1 hypothetical protein E8D37_17750 [Nocardioides sp. GY 10127]
MSPRSQPRPSTPRPSTPRPSTPSTPPSGTPAPTAPEGKRRRGLLSLPPPALAFLVLVVVVGVLVAVTQLAPKSTPLAQAVALAPADTQRYSFTDWSAVRDRLGVTGTNRAALKTLLDDGYDADLTSESGLTEAAPLLLHSFGWSPLTAEWEVLAQSEEGVVDIVRVESGTEDDVYAGLADDLEAAGYTAPSDRTQGVWVGGDDVLAALEDSTGLEGSSQLAHVALDEQAGLVLASDNREYLADALDAADAAAGSDTQGVTDVVSALDDAGDPLSVSLLTGDQACTELSMAQADSSDQATADGLVADAGGVDPLTGWAMATMDGSGSGTDPTDVLVAMGFTDSDTAEANARSRTTLASGDAPGQGGSFTDRFNVEETAVDDDVATLLLSPVDGTFFSDVSTGPVLFAACR